MSDHILSGPEPSHRIVETNLGDYFFLNADKYRNRICHIDGTIDQTETYDSIKLRSTRVAIALQKRKITSEDVIVFCSPNTIDNTVPMLATFYLGAKVANLEASLSVRHTNHLLSLVTPKIIFVDESAINLIEESLAGVTFETEVIVFGTSDKYVMFSDLLNPQEEEESFRPSNVDPNDVVLIIFSSGSTGLPKAICHTHRSVLWIGIQAMHFGMCGTVFHFSTFYWVTAVMMLTSCFGTGSRRVFARNTSAEDVFKIIDKYKVSSVFVAPIITYKLTRFEDAHKYDSSSLKTIICGGTPMAPPQIEKMNHVFPTALTFLGYGMSEMGIAAGFTIGLKALARRKMGSCGLVAPGVQLKIVDTETEEILDCDRNGEIRLKSPSMMVGYYREDYSYIFDNEGFLKTGDVGYYDEDKCVHVIGRTKEMFKYLSWHIIPSVLEEVLLEHPDIKEAVVFGIPRDEEGEVPAACVVLKEDSTLGEKEIDDFLKERVADRERLRGGVTFVDVLPRTPTGKVVRNDVKNFVLNLKKSH